MCLEAEASRCRCKDSQSQCSNHYHEQGVSPLPLAAQPSLPRQAHSPHCGRRTHSSSSHRTSHRVGGWRTRCKSCAQSCYPLPRPDPHLPHRPGHCVQICAPCTQGPCCNGEGPRGESKWCRHRIQQEPRKVSQSPATISLPFTGHVRASCKEQSLRRVSTAS